MPEPRDPHYYLLEADAQLQHGEPHLATANALTGVLASIEAIRVKEESDTYQQERWVQADSAVHAALNVAGRLEAGDFAGNTAVEVASELRSVIDAETRYVSPAERIADALSDFRGNALALVNKVDEDELVSHLAEKLGDRIR